VRTLWRISVYDDLRGIGGEKGDGRWHTAEHGKRIVYLSEHPALALIEVLVNLKGNPLLFPDRYRLIKITIEDRIVPDQLEDVLPPNWKDDATATRHAGDTWLASASTALLAVPSAPCPEAVNYLFNPLHTDAPGVKVEWVRWVEYDKRLFKTVP
jgi:RES domain-containing protein